jgi:ketosteroid isomerase-like protein
MNIKLPLVLLFFASFSVLYAQSLSDKRQILEFRNASNHALKSYDPEKVLSFLTDDVLTTTGNGTLLSGKEALRNYIMQNAGNMFWIRTSIDIEINEKSGLAWETGTWKGYDPDLGDHSIVGGKYTAMWSKQSGLWHIKSELFVTLE